MDRQNIIKRIIESRKDLSCQQGPVRKAAEEGGCGVTGFIASVPVRGRHILTPSVQMHNRGNGKGGGIAAVGLSAEDMGVPQDLLDTCYLLQIALLDTSARGEVEKEFIEPLLDVFRAERLPTVDDYREVPGLECCPPEVWRYLVRVKPGVLERFMEEKHLGNMDPGKAEDEFIYQNSHRINHRFYSSDGRQRAFVLSHGHNLMVLKVVGYAEQVVQYYRLGDFHAHGWIAHQRYPTRGRVWHPGGAHPFIGLDEALVHNGDFANYYAVCEYLRQHNIYPQFLTDTEVSALMLDLLNRTFEYPLEYIIEAMAPTGEYDFDLLSPGRQDIYRCIQSTHIHASPDGPWFFIIARNATRQKKLQLIGITDTSMLRPQVFALQEGDVQIGLICSEKQAIDATLESIASEDTRFCPVADRYWNCRGGSATDGGAFIFTVEDDGTGVKKLTCSNKFGEVVKTPPGQQHYSNNTEAFSLDDDISRTIEGYTMAGENEALKAYCRDSLPLWSYSSLISFCAAMAKQAKSSDKAKQMAIDTLTYLNDMPLNTGSKKRSSVLQITRNHLRELFRDTPYIGEKNSSRYRLIDYNSRDMLSVPQDENGVLLMDVQGFPPEGEECDARLLADACELGWKKAICFNYSGQRFCGCGLTDGSKTARIDVYGSSGDYLASGIDGTEIYVHGNAQDQLGQIMMKGKLVIYGDVGQTFMYGAKGGEVYVLGNAAGRPLINAVGSPRVVINGTCLDYLAESFMAGDPLRGGGFVIMNGIEYDVDGRIVDQANPYPGSNLFSLASGGAIYLRDPYRKVTARQLNGGEIVGLAPADWELILPYLLENERLFGISVENDLLMVNGEKMDYSQVYRKVQAVKLAVLNRVEMDREDSYKEQDEEILCLPEE